MHGAWFPRLVDGRLRLSDLDAVLLEAVGDAWITPGALVRTLREDRYARLLWPFDAFFHVDRLRAWAARGVLEHEANEDENPFVRDRFRATPRSRALAERGLGTVGDAPPLHVGGCVVNDPASPWVRIEEEAAWRLVLRA